MLNPIKMLMLMLLFCLIIACGGGGGGGGGSSPHDGVWQGPLLAESVETGGATNVRLAVGQNGHVVVSWSVFHGAGLTDVFVDHYDPATGWQGAVAPSRDIDHATHPDMKLVIDSAGNALGVWGERQISLPGDPSTFFATTYDAGTATWSEAVAMDSDDTGKADRVAVAAGPGGSFWVLFGLNMGTSIEIRVNHYTPAGGWSGSVLLDSAEWDPADNYLEQLAIAVDAGGNAAAAWSRYLDTDGSGDIDIAFDHQSVFARYYDAGTMTWASRQTLNTNDLNNAFVLDLQAGPTGGFLVLWGQFDAAYNTRGWARFYRGGSLQPAVSLWDHADNYYPYGAAFDSAGNAFVLASAQGVIAAFRYQEASGWQSPEILQPDSGWDKNLEDFSVSPGGDAFAVWKQEISGEDDVFVRRYDFYQDTWEEAVNIDTPDSGEQVIGARIVSDADGNAMASWYSDNGLAGSYYAARYFGAASSWGAATEIDNGALDTVRYSTCLGMDGDGTVMAAWAQGAGGEEDIYSNVFD